LIVITDSKQCTLNADCRGFPGLRTCDSQNICAVVTTAPACMTSADCSAIADGVCAGGSCTRPCMVAADCGSSGVACTAGQCATAIPCTVNANCAKQGKYFICRKDTLTCVNLASQDCTNIVGDYANDNAFIFGSLLPTSGPDATTGVPIEQAIELAIDDFKSNSNGLPPAIGSTANRPLVVVSCSDNSDTPTAERATKHLVNDVGTQAIIGSAFSGITIDIATTITIPAGVLLFSPSATSDAITNLLDKGLVWRTSPADGFQASALNLYLQVITGKLTPKTTTPKVAIFNKGDAYGEGLATAVTANIARAPNNINTADASQFVAVEYGNPDDPTSDPTHYGDVVTKTLGAMPTPFYPQVVFILGTNEGVDNILESYENAWSNLPTSPGYQPVYIFSDGGEVSDLSAYLAAADGGAPSGLRTRISGSVPGSIGPVYTAFLTAFGAKYAQAPPSAAATFGAAGAYDIVYLLAYSAAGISSEVGKPPLPLTAANLITGFSRLVPTTTGPAATLINAGTGNGAINMAFSTLTQTTNNIDYNGASGPLDFMIMPGKTGQAPSDIQIWCAQADTTLVNSGLYYDPLSPTMLSGTFGPNCN
jgi:branched-chain amino acid transport system substrate-binding protein